MHLFGKTTIPGQHISKQNTEEREQNMRAEQTTWPNAEIAFLVFTRGRFTEELIKQIFLTKIYVQL